MRNTKWQSSKRLEIKMVDKRDKRHELCIESTEETPFEFYLMTAGLLTTGLKPNLMRSAGLKSQAGSLVWSGLRGFYSGLICLMFWLFSLRQFVLIFIEDTYVQLMLGDITSYWTHYRLYYLLPSFFLSFQSACCCSFFLAKESSVNWAVPFVPTERTRQHRAYLYAPYQIKWEKHSVRIRITIYSVLFVTFGSTMFVGYETFRTAYEGLDEGIFCMWIPWFVIVSTSLCI